ncbi:hypothetical protein [Sphingobium baderi]|uniref:hypothetical protein n=1 Tax=Sphingobium baderi TaxID=1332080 RepID=UPI00042580E4|nr:hypothetical protein [Sphingobium baderi]
MEKHPPHDHANLLGFHAVIDSPEGMTFVSGRPAIFVPQPAVARTGHSHNPALCGSDFPSFHGGAGR